jgi:hypothetical protein
MAIEAQELTGSQQDNVRPTAVDYPKVEPSAADVQHHRPGEPVGTIPLSDFEKDIPHHAGANPDATSCGPRTC